MLCHLVSWACCHWTTHWHFVSFAQNILHNISHTHLLTVPNTVGSVSSLSVTGCQATISSCSAVFPFGSFSPSSKYRLSPWCPLVHNGELSFFLLFSLSLCGAPLVAWLSTCLQLAFLKQIRWCTEGKTVGRTSHRSWIGFLDRDERPDYHRDFVSSVHGGKQLPHQLWPRGIVAQTSISSWWSSCESLLCLAA